MPYLLRTFTDTTERAPEPGSKVQPPEESVPYDVSDKVSLGYDNIARYNHAPYVGHAAVGYNDPMFSLFPLVRDGKPASDKLIGEYYNLHDFYDALPALLKAGDLRKAKASAKQLEEDAERRFNLLYDDGEYTDDYYPELMVELAKGIPSREKNKYARLLRNLRSYGPNEYSSAKEASEDYDRPQHALVQMPLSSVVTAKDAARAKSSAERDFPNEFRVKDYAVKGLWSPRQVDSVVKKYFPDYVPGRVEAIEDDNRARDALQDLLQIDADEVLSDEKCKQILDSSNEFISSCMDKRRRNNSIIGAIKKDKFL